MSNSSNFLAFSLVRLLPLSSVSLFSLSLPPPLSSSLSLFQRSNYTLHKCQTHSKVMLRLPLFCFCRRSSIPLSLLLSLFFSRRPLLPPERKGKLMMFNHGNEPQWDEGLQHFVEDAKRNTDAGHVFK